MRHSSLYDLLPPLQRSHQNKNLFYWAEILKTLLSYTINGISYTQEMRRIDSHDFFRNKFPDLCKNIESIMFMLSWTESTTNKTTTWNIKSSIFEMSIITQTLNIDNLSIHLHIIRKHSCKKHSYKTYIYSYRFRDIAVRR